MSFVNVLDDGGPPPFWSNLSVNSIKANEVSVTSGPLDSTSEVWIDTTSGDDSNDGLTETTPVATLKKAITVAGGVSSAQELIINIRGTDTQTLAPYTGDSTIAGWDKVLDLTVLGTKFTYIRFKGYRSDVLEIPAGNATRTEADSFNGFQKYTYDGLTNPVHYLGHYGVATSFHNGKYAHMTIVKGAAAADYVEVDTPNLGMENSDWSIGLVDGPFIQANYSIAVVSACPVVFQWCRLSSGTTAGSIWGNFTPDDILMVGCSVRALTDDGFLGKGKWDLQGCFLSETGYSDKSIFTPDANAKLQSCDVRCEIETEEDFDCEYSLFVHGGLKIVGSTAQINQCHFQETDENVVSHCIELVGSRLTGNNIKAVQSAANIGFHTLQIHNSIVSIDDAELRRNTADDLAGAGRVINMTNSTINFGGDSLTLESNDNAVGHCINMVNSTLNIDINNNGTMLISSYTTNILAFDSRLNIRVGTGMTNEGFAATTDPSHNILLKNSDLHIGDQKFAFTAETDAAIRAYGLSKITVEASGGGGFANAGTGNKLYQLGGAGAVNTFSAGYDDADSNSGAGKQPLLYVET